MPLLTHPRDEADLTDAEADELVTFALAPPWADHWASKALDWIDQGVGSPAINDALRRVAKDKTYSQATRHRAWHKVKHER